VGLLFAAVAVLDGDRGAEDHPIAREARRVDDVGEGELGLEVADATLDEGLALLGRRVVGVLGEVPVATGLLDRLDVRRALDLLVATELLLQHAVTRGGHRDLLSHVSTFYPLRL